MIVHTFFLSHLSILENAMAIEDEENHSPIEHKSDEVHVVAMSHVGCVREETKTTWEEQLKMVGNFLLCDGMGGHSRR